MKEQSTAITIFRSLLLLAIVILYAIGLSDFEQTVVTLLFFVGLGTYVYNQ